MKFVCCRIQDNFLPHAILADVRMSVESGQTEVARIQPDVCCPDTVDLEIRYCGFAEHKPAQPLFAHNGCGDVNRLESRLVAKQATQLDDCLDLGRPDLTFLADCNILKAPVRLRQQRQVELINFYWLLKLLGRCFLEPKHLAVKRDNMHQAKAHYAQEK